MRSLQKLLLAGGFAVAMVGVAGQADAVQYNLTVNGCSSGCSGASFGTVTVTGTTTLHVAIDLATNIYFNQAGKGHDAVAFDLVGNPLITISGESAVFTVNGTNNNSATEAAGSNHEGPFGNLDYVVDWLGPPTNNGNLFSAGIQHMSFDVTAASAPVLEGNGQTPPVFFAVDIAQLNSDHVVVGTGLVGATAGGVPEPATWGLMIAGFGGMGALMRRKRRQGSAAVA
jgi:hypothetical protein